MIDVNEWYSNKKRLYKKSFGQDWKHLFLYRDNGCVLENSAIAERSMRCDMERKFFNIGDDSDKLEIIANTTLIMDKLKGL